jgi:hypothetical protein
MTFFIKFSKLASFSLQVIKGVVSKREIMWRDPLRVPLKVFIIGIWF